MASDGIGSIDDMAVAHQVEWPRKYEGMWTINYLAREKVNVAWVDRSQRQFWWKSAAILTYEAMVKHGYRHGRSIEPAKNRLATDFTGQGYHGKKTSKTMFGNWATRITNTLELCEVVRSRPGDTWVCSIEYLVSITFWTKHKGGVSLNAPFLGNGELIRGAQTRVLVTPAEVLLGVEHQSADVKVIASSRVNLPRNPTVTVTGLHNNAAAQRHQLSYIIMRHNIIHDK